MEYMMEIDDGFYQESSGVQLNNCTFDSTGAVNGVTLNNAGSGYVPPMTPVEKKIKCGGIGETIVMEHYEDLGFDVRKSPDHDPNHDMTITDTDGKMESVEVKTSTPFISKESMSFKPNQLTKCTKVDRLVFVVIPTKTPMKNEKYMNRWGGCVYEFKNKDNSLIYSKHKTKDGRDMLLVPFNQPGMTLVKIITDQNTLDSLMGTSSSELNKDFSPTPVPKPTEQKPMVVDAGDIDAWAYNDATHSLELTEEDYEDMIQQQIKQSKYRRLPIVEPGKWTKDADLLKQNNIDWRFGVADQVSEWEKSGWGQAIAIDEAKKQANKIIDSTKWTGEEEEKPKPRFFSWKY